MKRQNIRNGILLLSFLIFPITQFYYSPYIIVKAAAKGIISGSLLVFAALFFGGIFFGKAFCGWIMPCGGLQEICFKVNNKRVKGGKLNFIKYIVWILWILSIAWLVIRHGGYEKIKPFYMIHNGISVSQPAMYIIYYGVIVIFLLLSFFVGKRALCHYLCWMAPFMIFGRKVGHLLRLPMLRLKAESSNCKGCNRCVQNCPMSLDVATMVRENRMENTECILCGNCVDTCTENAIKYSFGLSRESKANKKSVDIS